MASLVQADGKDTVTHIIQDSLALWKQIIKKWGVAQDSHSAVLLMFLVSVKGLELFWSLYKAWTKSGITALQKEIKIN